MGGVFFLFFGFFFPAEDVIRDGHVTGVQTCALPISLPTPPAPGGRPCPALCPPAAPAASSPTDAARHPASPRRRAGADGWSSARPDGPPGLASVYAPAAPWPWGPRRPAVRGNPVEGARYVLRGIDMLRLPGLRRFVAIPLGINLVVFASLIALVLGQVRHWMQQLLAWLPNWLGFLEWILWPLTLLLLLVVVLYSFSVLANLIASPFNGLLAEKVELMLGGELPEGDGVWAAVKDAPRAMGKELAKLGYYLPRALAVLVDRKSTRLNSSH